MSLGKINFSDRFSLVVVQFGLVSDLILQNLYYPVKTGDSNHLFLAEFQLIYIIITVAVVAPPILRIAAVNEGDQINLLLKWKHGNAYWLHQ